MLEPVLSNKQTHLMQLSPPIAFAVSWKVLVGIVGMRVRVLLSCHGNIWRGQISIPVQICWREDGDWEGEEWSFQGGGYSFHQISG